MAKKKKPKEQAGQKSALRNYEQLYQALKKKAAEHEAVSELDEWAELENRAEKLKAWLDAGATDEPPVDLAAYDLVDKTEDDEGEAAPEDDTSDPAAEKPGQESQPETGATASAPPSDEGSTAAVEVERVDEELTPELEEADEFPVDIEIETPEQAELRKQLAVARQYLDAGRLREAVATCRALEGRVSTASDLADAVADLLGRAQRALTAQLEAALDAGDAARAGEDDEAARQHYRVALDLDPENSHARRALLDLDQAISSELTQAELTQLRAGLKERRDLRRLSESVFKAEALDAKDNLTEEIASLLREARQAFEDMRRAHGEATTMMRFDDLAGRRTARDRIAERVAVGERSIFDVTTNALRDAYELLGEANQLLEERSSDTATYEIDRVNNALPRHPAWAAARLQQALEKPFHEHHRNILEDKLQEVETLLEDQKRAEALLAQADQNRDDHLAAFSLLLQTRDAFPHLRGLEERIVRGRQTAAETLAAQMRKHYQNAEPRLRGADSEKSENAYASYQAARDLIAAAEALPARWPEPEKPAELLSLIAQGEQLREQLNARERLRKEFDELVAAVRAQVPDPNRRQAGLDLYRQLREDERFADFAELRVLMSDMDQYTGIGEQLSEAETEQERGNWERVRELAEKIKQSGKAGEFSKRVDALFKQANLELNIAQAREHLAQDEIKEASRLLQRVTKADASRENELREELGEIKRCKDATPPMQSLFDRGRNLRRKHGAAERLEALQLFRHVAGQSMEADRAAHPDWPPYQRSLVTVEARREARTLSAELRAELLPSLQEAFEDAPLEKIPDGAIRRTPPSDAETLRVLAERAQALRESGLLESEDERAVVRWVEVAQRSRDAQAKESLDDWDGAAAIWRELDRHHPGTPEVETGLRNARIHQVVAEAQRLLENEGQGETAVNLLRAAQREPGLGKAWEINLALADAHADLGDFDRAFDALNEAAKQPDGKAAAEQKRVELDRERRIQLTLNRAREELRRSGGRKDALRTLQAALAQTDLQDAHQLHDLRRQILDEAERELLETARVEQQKGSDDGKVNALVALVDLQELEELVGRPQDEQRSLPEMQPLRAELAPVAEAVAKEAIQFTPHQMNLENALAKADELAGRLQTFKSVARLFGQELGQTRETIDKRRKHVADQYEKLKQLQALLEDARQPALWEQALSSGNFDALEQKRRGVEQVGDLAAMLEVQQFTVRVQEWQEMHAYLMQAVGSLKIAFGGTREDFERVATELARLRLRPDLRPKDQPWRQLQQVDYDAIRRVMNNGVRVVDTFSEDHQDIVGWQALEQAAKERAEELKAWQQWQNGCRLLMTTAENAYSEANKNAATLTDKRQGFEMARQRAQAAIQALSTPPQFEGQVVPVRSGKAKEIKTAGERWLGQARNWLHHAGIALDELESEPVFPTGEEFKAAVDKGVATGNWTHLEELIQRAQRVGTTDTRGQELLKTYERTWKRETGKSRNIIKRLFNLD